MFKLDKKSLLQLTALILFFLAVTYLLYSFGLVRLFLDRQRMLSFIKEHRAYASLVFIGIQALQVVAAPVPGEVSGFVGGYLFGTVWGIIYSTIGLTIGSWVAFMISRLLGRHIVEAVANPEVIRRYDYVMKHKGLLLAFIMFLIPGFPKDILCYVLGLGHMGQGAFLLVSTTGRLLGTTLLTVGGTLFRDARYGAFFTVAGIGVGVILAVMVYRENLEQWFRKMRAKQRRQARAEGRKKRKRGGERDAP